MLLSVEAGTATNDPLLALLQYGVLGIFAALLIMYARTSIRREQDRADKAESQVKELNDFIRNELLPKQVEATILHKQVVEALGDAVDIISEIKILERNDRRRP
jgi:hypothetical protein